MKWGDQKTKAELLRELDALRHRVAQLEEADRWKGDQWAIESEQTFRTIFNDAADGILVADVESKKFRMANKAICQLLDYNSQEIKNLGVVDIHPEEDLPFVLEQFEKQARRKFTLSKNIPVRKKDGRVFYADINSFLIKLAGKTYLMGVFRDVTEGKKTEERQTLRFEISKTFQSQKSLKNICKKIVSLIKEHLDCEVAALRMKEGEDYPYFANNGFSQKFIKSENYLCVHERRLLKGFSRPPCFSVYVWNCY